MFNFCNLYSGSSGNCSFIGTENTNILIDCGESQKKINTGLESIGKNLSDIDAIIVTHEHSDHVKNLGAISKKYNIPVYANEKTFENIKHIDELGNEYWEARELMLALEYSKWEHFAKVINKAKLVVN